MSLPQAIFDSLKGKFVPDKIKDERLEKCNKCEFKVGLNCGKCACFISWKTAMPRESCPVGNWSVYEQEK